jgi:hypothetical protein
LATRALARMPHSRGRASRIRHSNALIITAEAYRIWIADGVPASLIEIIFIAAASIVFAGWGLELLGLYLYAYRSAETWNPAPIPEVADSDTLTI